MPRAKRENDIRILRRAQRVWVYVYIEGFGYKEAWKKACPVSTAKMCNWRRSAQRDCRLFEKKYGRELQKILDAANLGLPRVAVEIAKSLNQKKIELHLGEIVKDENGEVIHFDDNVIQQKGRELLCRIHGLGTHDPPVVPITIEIVNPFPE